MGKLLLSLLLIFTFTFTPISAVRAADNPSGETQQIELLQDHWVLFPQNGVIGIQEILQINNKGTEAFQKETGWLFPLPEGFTDLEIDGLSSDEFSVVKGGVQIYGTLPTGETQMILFYNIPASYPVTLTRKVPFPTQSFFVISPDSSSIQSNSLKDQGQFDINGKTYLQMSRENLSVGEEINFTLVNNSTSSSSQKENRLTSGYKVTGHPSSHIGLFNSEPLVYTNPHLWAGYLFIMLSLAIATSILFYRQKQKGEIEPNIRTDSGTDQEDLLFLKLKRKQDHLLERLRSLDEDHNSGEIQDEEYEEVRNNTKKLLIQVKLQLRALTEDEEAPS